eukprot:symbB.v1.2.009582.t2/scaffold611.1/size181545/5
MTSCEKADRWQQALELFKTMRTIRIETDVVSYAAAISSCGKMGKWKEALQFCDEMFSTKVQHNLISYSAVINAVEKGNEWKKALMMFDLMPFLRLVPSAITYGSALSACDSASQWQQALSLWLEAKEAQVTPDAIAYSVTISSCGKAAQWQHALWFLQMRHAEIAGFQLRQPRGADVTRLVLEPDDSYQWCPVFTTIGIDILLGFSKRSTVSALEAVEIWIDVVWADHLCIWAILMHQWMLQRFGVGRFVTFDAQSQRLWLRKTSSQPGTPTNSVKEVKLKDESLGTWGATFRELHTETWCKLDGAEQREIARVHEVIAALASREVRVWARAILLPFVHKKKGRAQKLQIHELLQALSSRNQPEMLHTVLEELRQETGLLDLRNYTAALTAYSKSNHWRLASEVFSKMIADKIQPDVMSFTAVIGAHARGSCVEGARELFNAMADHVVQPNVFSYSACISAYEKMGRWKEPLELPLGFLYGLHKDFITINLAMFKWKAHQWQLGLCFFSDSSAKLADRITFNVAISLCGKVSQWRRALDIFQSMQSYAQDVSMSPDVVTFSSLISACQKAFQWQQACLLFYVMGSFKVAPNLTCFNALISICDAWRYTNGEIKLWMEG